MLDASGPKGVAPIKSSSGGIKAELRPKSKREMARSMLVTMFNENQAGKPAYTVLLSGASGVLGTKIAAGIEASGWQVKKLVRRKPEEPRELLWNPTAEKPVDRTTLMQIEGVSAAIHLSGANVAAKRWTSAYKKEIADSRIQSTVALSKVLGQLAEPPRVLVSASAIGFFGDRGDELLEDDSAAGVGFFPDLCRQWEASTAAASIAGIRVVHPRFGVVLSREGGALAQMKTLFRLGLGGKLGSGRQWMSWIAEADAVGSVLFGVTNEAMEGPFNAVAPEPVTNADFTEELARVVHRPAFMTAPALALRLAFGEMADEALLASTRAVPRRLEELGYSFLYPELGGALRAALD